MSNLEKIFKDSINGPQSIEKLNASEWIALITIHNKKFTEAIVECGNTFDLYTMDTQKYFNSLSQALGANKEQAQLIEMNNIYANNCTFLFPEEDISNEWVKCLLNLHDKGFLNFPPRFQNGANLLNELTQIHSKKLKRSKLVSLPVLIPTLNVINCNVMDAERHFITKTPQYARYAEAIMVVKNNPKAMKSIHDVYCSLIYMDEVIFHFKSNIAPHLASTSNNELLEDLLVAIKLEIDEHELSSRELNEALQFSRVNMLLNWLFKADKLNKVERIAFLKHITLQHTSTEQIKQYLIENNLLL